MEKCDGKQNELLEPLYHTICHSVNWFADMIMHLTQFYGRVGACQKSITKNRIMMFSYWIFKPCFPMSDHVGIIL